MQKSANELIFISRIKRDGSGTEPITKSMQDVIDKDNVMFDVNRLSLSKKTFIASYLNSYVVKLK